VKPIPVHCKFDKLEPVEKLKPNPRNPRTHPAEEIASLARIIKETGWRRAIVVSKRSGLIVRGHGAVQAARLLDCPVPVELQNFKSQAEEHAHMIADNRLAELAAWNDAQLADVLKELDYETKALSGYDPAAELLEAAAAAEKSAESIEPQFQILVDCRDEAEQITLLERFTKQKINCRALTT
jgi:hypothetical protein